MQSRAVPIWECNAFPTSSAWSIARRRGVEAISSGEVNTAEEAMAALITTPRLMMIGGGALAELAGLLARLGLSRPLIVTDPYIARCGILDRLTGLLDQAQIPWSVFSDTVSD